VYQVLRRGVKVYNYDPQSFELIDASDADPDPLTPGEYLIPANATTIAPPSARAFEAPVFDPAGKRWTFVDVSYRFADNLLRMIAQRLAEVGPLFDAYSDLAALGELNDDGIAYLQALRLYRVQLRMVHQQPGFPANVTMPDPPEIRPVPFDPLRTRKGD
jgi:hypothetical protein